MKRPRILLTRSAEGNRAWSQELLRLGAEPLGLACLEHRLADDPHLSARLAKALGPTSPNVDWLALTSPRGVRSLRELVGDTLPPCLGMPVAAVGEGTAEACRRHLGRFDLVADPPTGRGLAENLRARYSASQDGRIVIAAADRARPELERAFAGTAVEILRFEIYRTVPADGTAGLDPKIIPKITIQPLDALFFASPSAIEGYGNLLTASPELKRATAAAPILAIGPTTADALAEGGLPCHAVAEEPRLEALWQAFLALERTSNPTSLPEEITI